MRRQHCASSFNFSIQLQRRSVDSLQQFWFQLQFSASNSAAASAFSKRLAPISASASAISEYNTSNFAASQASASATALRAHLQQVQFRKLQRRSTAAAVFTCTCAAAIAARRRHRLRRLQSSSSSRKRRSDFGCQHFTSSDDVATPTAATSTTTMGVSSNRGNFCGSDNCFNYAASAASTTTTMTAQQPSWATMAQF